MSSMSYTDEEPCKILLPFIRRANEIDKYEPRVAFYCRIYAMESVLRIPLKKRTGVTNGILESLLKRLMKDESVLGLCPKDQIYIQKFATKLFFKADRNEIRGKVDMNTAKTFYAASLFIGILNFFGQLQPELEVKQRYAAWRAAEIRKALTRKATVVSDAHSENQTSRETTIKGVLEEKSSEKHNPLSGDQQKPLESLSSSLSSSSLSESNTHDNSDGQNPLETLSSSMSSSSLSESNTSDNGSNTNDNESRSRPGQSNGNNFDETVSTVNVVYQKEVLCNGEEAKINENHSSGKSCVYRPSADNIIKAQKLARMAVSSLGSNDVPSAISFLQEAVDLLTTNNS